MKRLWFGVVFAISAVVSGAKVAASDIQPDWKTVGNWDLRVDRSLNYGCFMITRYHGGDMLRVGFDRKHQNGYVMLGNTEWKSIEAGKEYQLQLQFDNRVPWNGNAVAFEFSHSSPAFLFVSFRKSNFIDELAISQSLIIRYKGHVVSKLLLTGSNAAVRELIRCQQIIDQADAGTKTNPTQDPFATTTGVDPFAR